VTEATDQAPAGRAPRGLREQVLANCRPRPAIPALVTLFLAVLLPAMSAVPPGNAGTLLLTLVPVGTVLSCALAVGAGFCSLAPPALWLVGAGWALSLIGRAGLPGWQTGIVYACTVVAVSMIFVQLWRMRTGRFVPTIADGEPDRG
jgi:hypothetical protein